MAASISDIGSIRMVVNAMGYACFGGILGYFMGQARFEKTPAYYVPGGLGLAALLTGLYFFLLDRTAGDPVWQQRRARPVAGQLSGPAHRVVDDLPDQPHE